MQLVLIVENLLLEERVHHQGGGAGLFEPFGGVEIARQR